jgi:DNA-binding NarL/FixJ family response regulator
VGWVSRSSSVTPTELWLEVAATGPIERRIHAVLAAEGLAAQVNGRNVPGRIRIVGHDLGEALSVGRLRELLTEGPVARIIVVSPDCGLLGVRRAIRAGADAVVVQDELGVTLVPALRAVAAGLSAIPTHLREAAEGPALSHREREVLRLAIAGNTNSEIAGALYLAQSTVKSHLSSAYRKLGAGSRTDAASLILDPDSGLLEVVWPGARAGHNRFGRGAAAHQNGTVSDDLIEDGG